MGYIDRDVIANSYPISNSYKRKGDLLVTSAGRIIVPYDNGSTGWSLYYSDDGGDTWGTMSHSGGSATGGALNNEFSYDQFYLFDDDSIGVAFTDTNGNFWGVGCALGTVSGTAVTWNENVMSGNGVYRGDHVGIGWRSGSTYYFWTHPQTTAADPDELDAYYSSWNGSSWTNILNYQSGPNVPQLSSEGTAGKDGHITLDWSHTGDGMTPGASKHLWRSYIYNGTTDYVRLQKLVDNGDGTWTANSQRTIATWNSNMSSRTCDIVFDGSDVYVFHSSTTTDTTFKLSKRDGADTGTTALANTQTLPESLQQQHFSTLGLLSVVGTDSLVGVIHRGTTTSSKPNAWVATYSKSGNSWSSWRQIDETADWGTDNSFSPIGFGKYITDSTLRFYMGRDGTTDYWYFYEVETYNEAPTAPTITSPTDGDVKDVAEVLPVVWTFNDPDPGDTQSAYSLRKQIGTGSYSYWNGSVFTASESAATKIASSGTTHTISSSWGADGDANHKYAIKTWDAADAGPSDWDEVYVTPSAQDNPTVTAITTVTAPTYSVTWTVATQTKYRVRVYDDSGGSPVTSTVFYDSGTQVSAVTSHSTPFPDNSVTRHVGVVTWNDEGLLSDEDTEQLAVSYLVPPTPTVSMSTTGSESGVIWVSINNPTPGGGETVTDSNDVYRRVASEGGNGIRVAQGVAEDGGFNDYGPLSEVVYQYRARAINAGIGTAAYGAWTT